MKKFFKAFLGIFVLAIACVTLTGCEEKFNEWSTKTPPSCEEKGVETRTGNKGSVETRYIDSLGHSYGAWTVDTPASCQANGLEKKVCATCGHVDTRDIEKTDHTYLHIEKVAATETETGVAEHYSCPTCHKVFDMDKHETTESALVIPVIHFAGVAVDGDVTANLVKNNETGLYEGKFTMSVLYSRVKFVLVYDDGSKAPLTAAKTIIDGNGIIGEILSGAPYTNELYFDTDEMAAKGEFCYSLDTCTQYSVTYDLAKNKIVVNALDPRNIEGLTVKEVKVIDDTQATLTKNAETNLFEGTFQINAVWKHVRFVLVFEDANGGLYEVVLKYADTTFAGNGVLSALAGAPWTAELYTEADKADSGEFWYSRGSADAPISTRYTASYNPTTQTMTINVVDPKSIDGLTIVGVRCVDDVEGTLSYNESTGIYSSVIQFNTLYSHTRVLLDLQDNDGHKFVSVLSYDNTTVKGNGVLSAKAGAPWTAELYTETDNDKGEFCYSLSRSTQYDVSYDPVKDELTFRQIDARSIPGLTITSVEVIGGANKVLAKNESTGLYEGTFTLHKLWDSVRFIIKFVDEDNHNFLSVCTLNETQFAGNAVINAKVSDAPWTEQLFADNDDAIAKGEFSYSMSRSTVYSVTYDWEHGKITLNTVDNRDVEGLTVSKVEVVGDTAAELAKKDSGLYEGGFAMSELYSKVRFIIRFKDNQDHDYVTVLKYANTTFTGTGVKSAQAGATWDVLLYSETDANVLAGEFYYSKPNDETEYLASYDPENRTMTITAKQKIAKVELKGNVEKELTLNSETGKYEATFALTSIWSFVKFDVTYNDESVVRLTTANTEISGSGIMPRKVSEATYTEILFVDSDNGVTNGEFCYSINDTTNYKVVYDSKTNKLTIDVVFPEEITDIQVLGLNDKHLTKNESTGKFEGTISLDTAWMSISFVVEFSDNSVIRLSYLNTKFTGTGVKSAQAGAGWNELLYSETDMNVACGEFFYSIDVSNDYFVSYDPATNTVMINVLFASMNVNVRGEDVALTKNESTGNFEGTFVVANQWAHVKFVGTTEGSQDVVLKYANTTFAGDGILHDFAGCQWDARLYCDGSELADGDFCYGETKSTTYAATYDATTGTLTVNMYNE